jgi:hypothetical protein
VRQGRAPSALAISAAQNLSGRDQHRSLDLF